MSSTPLSDSSPAQSTAATADGRLSSGVLGTSDIVFMVLAAAAPMAVVVALMPMAFAFGNGAGVPGTYLLAIGAMLLFIIGYVRIIPFVQNAGAFYAYITASVGRIWGLAAAYIAALSYFTLCCSTAAALAFFTEQFFEHITPWKLHWSLWAFGSIVLTCWLSYYRITLAATVLAVALIAEILLILALDIAIVMHHGLSDFDLTSFSAGTVVTPGLGIAAIYAFNSMIGVEGTAIYQEEARRPAVTIPRATYISVVLAGLFYVFTAWCLTTAAKNPGIAAVAKADPGLLVFNQSLEHLGTWGANAVSILVLTSSFAAVLALFNNSARYLYALGRDGVMPRALSKTHPRHQSPYLAGYVLSVGLILVFAFGAIAHLDPLVNISTALVGVGSVGLMALLALTALVIPIFFAKRRVFGFATTIAPAVGGLVIASATVLAFVNYAALTGVDSALINNLPYALIVLAMLGAAQALWLRAKNPAVYARIGATRIEAEPKDAGTT